METIGIDVSLDVCKSEGYMMLEHDPNKEFDRTETHRVFRHWPEWSANHGHLIVDSQVSFDELEKIYKTKKESMDSSFETYKFVNFINPTITDLLRLASDVDSCQGLP